MVAPGYNNLSKDLGITNSVESSLTLSMFVLAYAVGPIFLGPMSEIYGRVPVLQIANLFYLVFSIGCGVSQTKTQMYISASSVVWVVVLRKPLAVESLVIAGDQKTPERRYVSIHLPLYSVQQLGHSPGVHHRIFHLQMGILRYFDCRRSHTDTWAFLPQRDLRGEDSWDKGQKTSQGNRQYRFEERI